MEAAGQDDFGEEFSDWESEVSKSANLETLEPNDLQGFLGHSDDVTSPGMAIAHGSVTGARREASRQEQLGEVPDAEVDPSHFIVGNSESAEIHASASVASSATASGAPNGAAEAPATDLMARMLGGLPSWATFSGADESEDEVHNAWGEQDTEEMMGQRALELQQARGIEIPGTPTESAAQARLAKRRQKAQAKQKVHLEVNSAESTESTAGNLFGMMSMLSGLANATASSAHGDDEEEVHNAWGGDDTDSNFAERAAELEQARGMVVPVLQVQTTGRERLAKRRQKGQKAQKQVDVESVAASGAPNGAAEAPATDLMARMLGGLPSWATFSGADESEDEVHNAWGEQDTEEMMGQRALELQQARGIEIPGTPTESAAQARLAKRRQKAQAKQKVHLEVNSAESTESTAGNLFGMMSMLSGLANATASSAHGDDKEEVHNAWGGDDTDSNFAERAAELEQARGMVVPVLQVQTTGRERLAKRRQKGQKAQKQLKSCEGHSEVSDEGLATYSGPVTASVFSAAATGMVQFQRLFNLVTSNEEDEIDEVFCIWGEEDSPEKHQERVVALEMARSDQSARLPHHRVLRQKRRGPASPSNKERSCDTVVVKSFSALGIFSIGCHTVSCSQSVAAPAS